MGICLKTTKQTSSQIHVLLTTWSCLQRHWKQLQKCCVNSKQSTEKVCLKIHPGKTKIFSNQRPSKKKEKCRVDNITVEMLSKEEKHKISGTINYIPAARDKRDQESYQGSFGVCSANTGKN